MGDAQTGSAPNLCYGDLRELLLNDYRLTKRKSLSRLADGREVVKGLTKLDEFFGFKEGSNPGTKLSALTRQLFDGFIVARRQEGVSESTIRNSATVLRRMFHLAEEHGLVVRAPKITVPRATDPREEYLTKEQFDRLCQEMHPEFRSLLTFLFFQGTRLGETMGLTWPQLNLRAGVFFPDAAANKTGNTDPKSLNDEVVRILRPVQSAEGLVFTVRRRPFEKAFRKAMLVLKYGRVAWKCSQCRATVDAAGGEARACPRCKTPMVYCYVGPSPHSLRASAVVFYREGGLPDTEIMKITGHQSLGAFRGYSRSTVENLKRQMDAALRNRAKFLATLD